MKNIFSVITIVFGIALLSGCNEMGSVETQAVAEQQAQYVTSQPVPNFNHSLERELLIELYHTRNQRVSTHSVWRSNYGTIEGDCTSNGYGIPYDTSITNPVKATSSAFDRRFRSDSLTTIEQPEPNGVYTSKNTSATWVFCVGNGGSLNPVYVEAKVTAYPYPVEVNYETGRVRRAGESSVNINPQ